MATQIGEGIRFVAIRGGNLDGRWYPTEWLRDARMGEKAGGAVFRATGELTSRPMKTAIKDPVTQETVEVFIQQQAYVYQEVFGKKRLDPRTRFICPVCPAEELQDGRFRNKLYTRDQLTDHVQKHIDEDPEGYEYATGEGAAPGSVVEYASPTSFGDRDVEPVGHLMPGGGVVAPSTKVTDAADPLGAIAASMGLTVEQVKERLLQTDQVAEVSPGVEVPVQEATSGAENDSPEPTSDAAPDVQESGEPSESSEGSTDTPTPATVTE